MLDDEKLLDEAPLRFEMESERSKQLVNSYLSILIPPKQNRNFRRRPTQSSVVLSKRKMKKRAYADFQRKYKRKRKAAFDNLYSNNSVSEELSHDEVFGIWSQLLCKKSIKFVDQMAPVSR